MAKLIKPHRILRKTLLAVGEGKSDTALLKYLKSMVCNDGEGLAVTIRNANGKGPNNVISTAIGATTIAYYDKKLCLLDTDIKWTNENKHAAIKNSIELVGSIPCLEGMLLKILGQSVPHDSATCKQHLNLITKRKMLDPEDFVINFSYSLLQNARSNILELDKLLCIFEGK